MRLNRYLSQGGTCSRRKADELILEGKVSVNGQLVRELGVQVKVGVDEVRAAGQRVMPQERQIVLLLNKPRGVLTTAEDPHGRRTVMDLVQLDERVVPVGRLDQDSSGALLLTNDGALMHLLLHPSGHVPKEYILLTDRELAEEEMAKLRAGVKLDGSRTKPCELERIGRPGSRPRYRMVLTEGRNRQIRRMLASLGVDVERLQRRSIAGISMEDLEPGEWRVLLRKEVDRLRKAARLASAQADPADEVDRETLSRLPQSQRTASSPGARTTRRVVDKPAPRSARPGFKDEAPRRERPNADKPAPRSARPGFKDEAPRRERPNADKPASRSARPGFKDEAPRRERPNADKPAPRSARPGFKDEAPRRERPNSDKPAPRSARPGFKDEAPRRERPNSDKPASRSARPGFKDEAPRRERAATGKPDPSRAESGSAPVKRGKKPPADWSHSKFSRKGSPKSPLDEGSGDGPEARGRGPSSSRTPGKSASSRGNDDGGAGKRRNQRKPRG